MLLFKSLQTRTSVKKIAYLVVAIGTVFSLSACNTIEGAGKDIERAGEKVQDAVK
jgi:entericidin A